MMAILSACTQKNLNWKSKIDHDKKTKATKALKSAWRGKWRVGERPHSCLSSWEIALAGFWRSKPGSNFTKNGSERKGEAEWWRIYLMRLSCEAKGDDGNDDVDDDNDDGGNDDNVDGNDSESFTF